MRGGLTLLVAVALVLVSLVTAFAVPEGASKVVVEPLPYSGRFVTLPNPGTYVPRCSLTASPTWWALLLSAPNGANRTLHLNGSWESTRPTGIVAGLFADDQDPAIMAHYVELGHCPLGGLKPGPVVATLPYGGSVDLNLTTYPDASRVIFFAYSFDSADVITFTHPLTLSAA